MNPGTEQFILLRFPCPVCRRWTPFETREVPCSKGHTHRVCVCPHCSHGFLHERLIEGLRSMLPLPNGELRGPITLSWN